MAKNLRCSNHLCGCKLIGTDTILIRRLVSKMSQNALIWKSKIVDINQGSQGGVNLDNMKQENSTSIPKRQQNHEVVNLNVGLSLFRF